MCPHGPEGDGDLESAQRSLRELDERFRLLVDSVKDYAIFILDPRGFITTWNAGAERIKGYRSDEVIGRHFSIFYPDDEVSAGKCDRELATALTDGRFEEEGFRLRKDGSRFFASVVITTLRDPRGHVVGFAKVTRDLTERRAAEDARVRLAQGAAAREEAERALQQLARLQALTGALAAAATPEELARLAVRNGVDVLGASTASFVRRADGMADTLEVVAVEGVPPDVMRPWMTFSAELRVPSAVAFRTERPEWVESAAEYERLYPDTSEALAVAAGSCSLPLVVRRQVAAVLTFRFVEPRRFSATERLFMETFASQAAQALDRAEAHVREVDARRRLEALSELAEALASAVTVEDVATIVVERGRRAAAADTCTLYTLDEGARELVLVAERGCNPSVLDKIQRIRVAGHPMNASLTLGKAVWVETPEEYAAHYPEIATTRSEGPRARAFWSVPLFGEGRPLGLLGMGFHDARRFPAQERAFVETFTRHCSEALLRARRLEAERNARMDAETLQASLATTLRSIGDAVIATDAAGRVTIMNPVAETLTGWSEAAARGQALHDVFRIINEQTREPVASPVDKVREHGTVVGLANHTVLVQRESEREIPIDDSGAPIRSVDGQIEGVVLVFRDVTEKKREEARRSLLEEATAALTESLDYQITLTKVARLAVPRLADWCAVEIIEEGETKSRQLAVGHVDPAKIDLARELGEKYPPNPDAPNGLPNVLRTGKSELYAEVTDDMLRAGAVDEEHLRIALDLQLRSAMIVPLIARGRTVGAMTYVWAESGHTYTKLDLDFAEELARRCAVAIDNARLYAAEQQARRTADVANRAKDEFLAMVSHELRTPLNAIMGWAKMMSSANLDEAKRARAIDTIDRNSVAMAQLIEDLLDISRIISGKMRLEVQPIDLERVVEAAIESVKPAADAKEIRVNAVLDTSGGTLMGDPARIQQVVWNLLSNAVKFTPKGGRIDVVTRREGSGLEISVTDTGKGIDPRFLPHVFDPFRQEDASHTRSRGGLGLGLAITRQLVELHGGQVHARSDGDGCGSTFTVFLPMATVAMTAEQRSGNVRKIRLESTFERPTQLRGLRALVVDDEEDARLLVKAVLEECGCEVLVAGTVADALAILQHTVPDVLISDIGMPVQDGYDLIRQVRALPAASGGTLPAAALTAYARAEERRRVLNAGYSMHIPKPVEPAELVSVVMSLTRYVQRPG